MSDIAIPHYHIDRILDRFSHFDPEATDPHPDDYRIDNRVAVPIGTLQEKLLSSAATDIARNQLREARDLTEREADRLASAIAEATHNALDEHYDKLVEAFQDAAETSRKERAIEILLGAAATKLVEQGIKYAPDLLDIIVELLTTLV